MRLFVFILISTICCYGHAQSAKDFAKLPNFESPVISPDGKIVAFKTIVNDAPAILSRGIYRKDKIETKGIPLTGLHVNWLDWANNDRLIISVRATVSRHRVGNITLSRIVSINRDGTDPVYFDMKPNKWGHYLQYSRIVDLLPNDPQHVLITLDHDEEHWGIAKVHKVNIYTGEKTLVDSNRKGFYQLISDNNGEIRVGSKFSGQGKNWSTFVKVDAEDNWSLLQKTSYFDSGFMRPVRFDYEDNNILLFTSKELEEADAGKEESNLYRYDLKKGEILGPYEHPAKQADYNLMVKEFPAQQIELVSYTDKIHLGKAFYKIQSDLHPPRYYLYDSKAKRLDYFGSEYPQLDKVQLSKMQEVEYKARDGLSIPAYLTLPFAKQDTKKPKLPLVVYPHGGPWARDRLGFDNYVQFFAHEGYAVFQPQFRGSTGRGIEFEKAGYKQWGMAIQDDITDGVKWLIDEGIVDPKRICIVGSSFGGYAVGMGLATTPDLYRCGISINGVMDMVKLQNELKYTIFSNINKELINNKWGIKAVSPVHLAKNITAPLLLIAGEADSIVDVKHSKNMHKTLQKKKKQSELLLLPNGEHWRTIESNEIITLERIQAFLKKYLQPEPA